MQIWTHKRHFPRYLWNKFNSVMIQQHFTYPLISLGHDCESANLVSLVTFCRDLVHRQTAMAAIQHMALGVYGFGCEDALTHLLNNVWPNVFESSPHVVQAFMGAVEGIRVGLGASKVLQYCLQVGWWVQAGWDGWVRKKDTLLHIIAKSLKLPSLWIDVNINYDSSSLITGRQQNANLIVSNSLRPSDT